MEQSLMPSTAGSIDESTKLAVVYDRASTHRQRDNYARADAARLLRLNRGHWSIENRSHYVRDFTYDEDRSQVRTANGPNSMASLRNFAISLLRLSGINTIASKLREIAARPHLAFKLIGV